MDGGTNMIVKCEEETIQYLTMEDGTEYIRIGEDIWKERFKGLR